MSTRDEPRKVYDPERVCQECGKRMDYCHCALLAALNAIGFQLRWLVTTMRHK